MGHGGWVLLIYSIPTWAQGSVKGNSDSDLLTGAEEKGHCLSAQSSHISPPKQAVAQAVLSAQGLEMWGFPVSFSGL